MTVTLPEPTSYVHLVDVHGNNPEVDRGLAVEVARYLAPNREILAVNLTEQRCQHRYRVWAVELSGPDRRVDYVPGLSGPHLPFIKNNPERPHDTDGAVGNGRPSES